MQQAKYIANLNAQMFFWLCMLLAFITAMAKGSSLLGALEIGPLAAVLLIAPTITVRLLSLRYLSAIQSKQLSIYRAGTYGAASSLVYALVLFCAALSASSLRLKDLSAFSTLTELATSLLYVALYSMPPGALFGALVWLASHWQLQKAPRAQK